MSDCWPLSRAFLTGASAQAAEKNDAATGSMSEGLESCLQDLYHKGHRVWPDLSVSAEAFSSYLGTRVPKNADPDESAVALKKLCAADLFLVCGCLDNQTAALKGLERSILSRVPSFLAALNLPPDEVKEVQQLVRTKLIVGSADKPPTLLEYAGRGELASWVRVATVRTALDRLRARDAHLHASSRATALSLMAPAPEPELDHIKRLYQPEFQRALEDSIATLSDQQRALLHMYFAGGLKTAQIAALFHVNQSTIVRQLAQARIALQDEMRRLLRERLHLGASEYESLLRLLQSQLDLSIRTLVETPIA